MQKCTCLDIEVKDVEDGRRLNERKKGDEEEDECMLQWSTGKWDENLHTSSHFRHFLSCKWIGTGQWKSEEKRLIPDRSLFRFKRLACSFPSISCPALPSSIVKSPLDINGAKIEEGTFYFTFQPFLVASCSIFPWPRWSPDFCRSCRMGKRTLLDLAERRSVRILSSPERTSLMFMKILKLHASYGLLPRTNGEQQGRKTCSYANWEHERKFNARKSTI